MGIYLHIFLSNNVGLNEATSCVKMDLPSIKLGIHWDVLWDRHILYRYIHILTSNT